VADRQAEKIMLGHGDAAESDLLAYLADAERQILDAHRAGPPAGAQALQGGRLSSSAHREFGHQRQPSQPFRRSPGSVAACGNRAS
jgi:hypothetical protein